MTTRPTACRPRRALLTLVALTLSRAWLAPAQAQTASVWRCGPGGRSYSDKPCADGIEVQVDDARSADEVEQAQAIAAREKRLAEQLRQERLQREQEARLADEERARAAKPASAEPTAPQPVWVGPPEPLWPARTPPRRPAPHPPRARPRRRPRRPGRPADSDRRR